MGSGCNTPTSNNCPVPVSSNCVLYQGDAVDSLNICTSDTETEVLTTIIDKILTLINGTGITPSGVSATCDFISSQLTNFTSPTLVNYLNVILTSLCTLNTNLTALTTQVNTPVTYTNPGCLTIPSSPTTPQVLQAVINQLCSLTTQVATLTTEVDNGPTLTTTIINQINSLIGNYLDTHVLSCANKGRSTDVDSNGNTVVQFNAMVPPLCPIPYMGSLANFDANGTGLPQFGYCGWQICNGYGGSPDLRGYAFAGATNVPGPNALDNRVDPIYHGDPTYAANIGDKKGEVKHILVAVEGPIHNHSITDPGHTHTIKAQLTTRSGGSSVVWVVDVNTSGCHGGAVDPNVSGFGPCSQDFTGKVLSNTTGITATNNNTLGGEPHENRQPTAYGCWIIRLS